MLSETEKTKQTDQEQTRTQPPKGRRLSRILPAVGLFFLAPLIGEFLLGNLPITWIWVLPILALFYGSGALLVREAARRLRLGWAGIIVLALAYAVIEEAFVTQSLFNPNYLGLRLLDFGYIPALGISAWWTVFVLGIHTIWSISVPIALIESLSPRTAHTPWLGPLGLVITTVLFIIGGFMLSVTDEGDPFMASSGQFVGAGVAAVVLIAAAIILGRSQKRAAVTSKEAPSPRNAGAAAFLLSSAFMALAIVHNAIPAALNVAVKLGFLTALAVLLWNWSKRPGWSALHRFAVAAGLVLTYIWYSFLQVPSAGDFSPVIDAVGNAVFAAGALALLAAARKQVTMAEAGQSVSEAGHPAPDIQG